MINQQDNSNILITKYNVNYEKELLFNNIAIAILLK